MVILGFVGVGGSWGVGGRGRSKSKVQSSNSETRIVASPNVHRRSASGKNQQNVCVFKPRILQIALPLVKIKCIHKNTADLPFVVV